MPVRSMIGERIGIYDYQMVLKDIAVLKLHTGGGDTKLDSFLIFCKKRTQKYVISILLSVCTQNLTVQEMWRPFKIFIIYR